MKTTETLARGSLEQSEKFRLLVESVTEYAIFLLDPQGTVESWNRGARTIVGYEAGEIIGQHFAVVYTPEDRASGQPAIQLETASRNGSFEEDGWRVRKDGSRFWANVVITALRDEHGAPSGFAVMTRDVTERRRAEREHHLHTTILATMAGGVCVVRASDQTIAFANPRAEQIAGYAPGTLVGQTLAALLDTRNPGVPALLDGVRRETASGAVVTRETQLRRGDGTMRTVRANISMLEETEFGNARVVVFDDITDLKEIGASLERARAELEGRVRARTEALSEVALNLQRQRERRTKIERALSASEARFDALFRSGMLGILVADQSGVVIDANDAFLRMVGYSRDEMLAGEVQWARLTPTELRAEAASRDEQLATRGFTDPWEKEYVRKDGTRIPVLVGGTAVDERTRIGVVADLTERKRAQQALERTEAQLRQSQKMEALGRLAGGVAHDFNNLLSVILSYAHLILAGVGPGDPLHDDVMEISIAGRRAADLTRQLLLLSRQELVAPRVMDLNGVLTGMTRMLERVIGEDIVLEFIHGAGVCRARVDPGHIEQVILNLVVNARDAMPTGGRLTIETDTVDVDEDFSRQYMGMKPGRHVVLSVSDTGCGMDRATQAQIFEPFFTTKEKGKGTGLGLSTVFGIVQQSGGTIWVYSEPDHGTTFRIFLPCVDAAVDEAKTAAVPTTLQGRETVLLVEDEAQVRAVALEILQRYGYRVLHASIASDALTLLATNDERIDLLLTDVVMPGMSGPDLARCVLSQRPGVRVIFMSGYTDDSVVRHGMIEAGAAYVQKPITPESLARKVREVLDAPAG